MHIVAIDLHVHTDRSDGVASPREMIRYAEKKHLDGLAITDHDKPLTEEEFEELQQYAQNLVLIPGVEVSSREGHILLLGVHEAPEKHTPIKDVIRFGRKKNAVIIVPHPFDVFRKGIGKVIEKIDFDAIEVYNSGSILPMFNKKAQLYAIKNNLVRVAGSDAHLPEAIGLAFTLIKTKNKELKEIYQSIRSGFVYPVTSNVSYLRILSLKLRRKILKIT